MIRLNRLTDYAIQLTAQLARRQTAMPATELASASGIPLPTVIKVLKLLAKAGLLIASRGVAGGYRLARPPEAISVASIVEALDGPIRITECIEAAPGTCDIETICPTRSVWQRINEAIYGALEEIRISELSAPPPTLPSWHEAFPV